MEYTLSDAPAVVRELLAVAKAEQLSFLAASIAYYALVSVFPLLLVVLAAATAVGGAAFADAVVARISAVLSPDATTVLRATLLDASARGGATLVGVVVFLWGGLRVFRGLDVAFSFIYGSRDANTFRNQVLDALLVLGGIAAAIVAAVLTAVIAAVSGVYFVGVLGTVGLIAALFVAFLPIYYVFPDAGLTPSEAAPGALFAAVGWTLLQIGFRIYAANAGQFDVYGVVGGVLLLVTWFYFAGVVILFGAVLNAVLSGHVGSLTDTRDRQLQQGPG